MSARLHNNVKSPFTRRVLLFFLLSCSFCLAQERMFPRGSLGPTGDLDEFKNRWYSGNLKALQEPALYPMAKDKSIECYRFLWLRSFSHPISVRLSHHGKDEWILKLKIAGGAAGFHPHSLIEEETMHLRDANIQEFLSQIDSLGFWKAPNPLLNDQVGTDGSQWIIEGVKDGNYHVIDRWSPKVE